MSITNPIFLGIKPEYTSLEKSHFVILPVPYEHTTSYKKGTKFGPQAIINASYQVELFDEELWRETWKEGIHTLPPFLGHQAPEKLAEALSDYVKQFIEMKKFLFVLGGEHIITVGPVAAYAKTYLNLSVLHMDAHADLRDEYDGSKYSHSCVIRRIIDFANIVQVGIRNISEDEYHLTNSKGIKTFVMHTHKNINKIISKILDELSNNVYITIDLDCLDPSIMPGVGTPVPGGLLWYDILDILRQVIYKKNVVACDIMELCPLENTVVSEFTAAKLIYRIMGYVIAKDKKNAKSKKPKNLRR